MERSASPAVSMSADEARTPRQLVVPLEAPHVDERGSLQVLLRDEMSIVRIESRPGTRRADHWHRMDEHFCYVERGSIEYLERPVGSTEAPSRRLFTTGEMFWTGPNVEHAMRFLEHTVFYAYSPSPRTVDAYENDLVRLKEPLGG